MKITKIYRKYKLPRNLIEHHYRVAGVALFIADHWSGVKLDRNLVKTVALLHDLGNLVKYDLRPQFTHLLKDSENKLDYWVSLQKKMVKKYGRNDYEATLGIARDLKLKPKALKTLEDLVKGDTKEIINFGSLELKTLLYADVRVSPYGVVSLPKRVNEWLGRYKDREDWRDKMSEIEGYWQLCFDLENEIDKNLSVPVAAINNNLIRHYLKELPKEEI